MIQNAPTLVKPLPTTIPMFKVFSGLFNAPLKFLGWLDKPSERGAFIIKVGLIFYDAFTGKQRAVPRHIFDTRASSLKKYPDINPDICYTATYYDGLIMSPELLTLELVLDAEAEGPHAKALNYVSLAGTDGGKVLLKDELTGETYPISPKLIINAAGPWIDFSNKAMGLKTHYIGGTKGSHLVLDNPALRKAIGDHEFFFENKDGRIVLIFPLFDKVMIGTSDIPIEDPDAIRCTDEEVVYFMEMVGRVFPNIKVSPDQIVYRFTAVRPLAFTQAKNAGQITRDHHVQVDTLGNIPVYSLIGGKWTSFRFFAEQVTDRTLGYLGLSRKASTEDLPIGAGKDALPLKASPDFTREEIIAMAKRGKIVHLDDLLLRRTLLAYLGQLNRPLVEKLAGWLGEALGWSETQKKAEIQRSVEILADRHQVQL
jgi:glycerol-3-phosphate dehydrogenase